MLWARHISGDVCQNVSPVWFITTEIFLLLAQNEICGQAGEIAPFQGLFYEP